MKNLKITSIVTVILIQFLSLPIIAQEAKKIIIVNENWTTQYKSQDETSLCAIFSDMSFLESELHRMGKGDFELSTMFVAYNIYLEKTLRRIRLRGRVDFDFDGFFNYDAIEIIKKYGIVPESDYTGLLGRKKTHNHYKFYKDMYDYILAVEEEGREGKLSSQWNDGILLSPWLEGYKEILNKNMGALPVTIQYDNKTMTPIEFSENIISIPYDDYIKVTSYSYLEFYQPGELLVDGNWLHKEDFYNIKIDEYIDLIDYALENGFTLTGDFHITEEAYRGDLGYADFQIDSLGTKINQNIRDNLYENWKTTDVHNVQIIGIARDETGKKYYKIKDSNPKKDFPNSPIYFSENYFRARVLAVMLHKDGIPSQIREKLSIK
jgi:bleomycin hydrolase